MSESAWHVLRGGKRLMPVPEAKLWEMAVTGQLLRDDLVWMNGMTEWVPAGTRPGLFDPIPPATASPVPVNVMPDVPGQIGYYTPAGGMPPRAAATLAGHAAPTGDVGDWPLDDLRVAQFQEAVKIRRRVTGAAQLYKTLFGLSIIGLVIMLLFGITSLSMGPASQGPGWQLLTVFAFVAALVALYGFTWRATMRSHRWAPLTMMILFLAAIVANLASVVIGGATPANIVGAILGIIFPTLFAIVSGRSYTAIPRYLSQPGWCQEAIVKAGL